MIQRWLPRASACCFSAGKLSHLSLKALQQLLLLRRERLPGARRRGRGRRGRSGGRRTGRLLREARATRCEETPGAQQQGPHDCFASCGGGVAGFCCPGGAFFKNSHQAVSPWSSSPKNSMNSSSGTSDGGDAAHWRRPPAAAAPAAAAEPQRTLPTRLLRGPASTLAKSTAIHPTQPAPSSRLCPPSRRNRYRLAASPWHRRTLVARRNEVQILEGRCPPRARTPWWPSGPPNQSATPSTAAAVDAGRPRSSTGMRVSQSAGRRARRRREAA